ncbi:MAG: hypothetical protein GWN93_26890 [Deltaproteobacteria bacterium]|nr:hypothetical protein [Deltaproteobacteria bacterium]
MYGKHFESTYTGSMMGSGFAVFAVWGYIIAHTKPNSTVELNPRLLSVVLGGPEKDIVRAIDSFCAADPMSRSNKQDGRKLIKVGQYMYHVVNYAEYRAIRHEDDRRAYNREKQRECRARRKQKSKDVNNDVNDSIRESKMSAHTEEEAEAEEEYYKKNIKKKKALKKRTQLPNDFEVTQDMKAWADTYGIADINAETENFRDYHVAKGSVFKDWNAAWRTWMRNSKRFSNGKASNGCEANKEWDKLTKLVWSNAKIDVLGKATLSAYREIGGHGRLYGIDKFEIPQARREFLEAYGKNE